MLLPQGTKSSAGVPAASAAARRMQQRAGLRSRAGGRLLVVLCERVVGPPRTTACTSLASVSSASTPTLAPGGASGVGVCGSRSFWLLSGRRGLVVDEDVAGVERPDPQQLQADPVSRVHE